MSDGQKQRFVESVYGIETELNTEQEQLTFTFNQKENLRFYLAQFLGRHLV